MINILLISDQQSTNHSAVEAIFSKYLHSYSRVVYFSKTISEPQVYGHRVIVPYKYKRIGLFKCLFNLFVGDEFDVVIVRNFYPILRQALMERKNKNFKLGFWNSWPHTYRRYYQAKAEKKSILRKFLEYKVNSYFNKRAISQCDFFLPITSQFKDIYFKNINVPIYPLGMGFDEDRFGCDKLDRKSKVSFVYIGTIDELRKTSQVVEAFHSAKGDFIFDIFTKSSNSEVERIKSIITNDHRISIRQPVSIEVLPKTLCNYNIGINFIPESSIFSTSSPTKVYEYYASGMPAFMNKTAEFDSIISNENKFLCEFDFQSIRNGVEYIISVPSDQISRMGRNGKCDLMGRSYKKISEGLLSFLITVID